MEFNKFCCRKNKSYVELYGKEKAERIKLFKERGFECIVIWETELKNENLVLKRLGV